MTQNRQTTLLDSIQSEVSREASPILEFLVKHSRKIVLAFAVLIVLVLAAGAFSFYTVSQKRETREALGKILVMPETQAKIAALESFADGAGPGVRTAAFMALANSATLQNMPEKAMRAWSEVAKTADAATRLAANLAQASALHRQGKDAEALTLLEGLLASAPADAQATVNSLIVSVAESLGNWDRALMACGAIVNQMNAGSEARAIWEQRLAYFASKK